MYRILQVEDNPGDADLLAEAIKEVAPSLIIEVAQSGVRALEYLHQATQSSRLPHLILLDLNMPIMDGFTLLRILSKNQECKGVPIVVLTSSTNSVDREKAAALGARTYVVKPSSYDDYLTLARWLSRYPNLDPTPSNGARIIKT